MNNINYINMNNQSNDENIQEYNFWVHYSQMPYNPFKPNYDGG